MGPRDREVKVRVSVEELARFERVAERLEVGVPEMIRFLVKREDEAALRAEKKAAKG